MTVNGGGSADVARRLLWAHVDQPPPYRAPVVYRVGVAISVAVALVAGFASLSAVHAARAARQEACAAKLDAWRARNPALAGGLRAGTNLCADLDRLVGTR